MIVLYFVLFLIAIIVSFYFSGTEAAFLAMNKPVYSTDLSAGNKFAKKLSPYVQNPQRALLLLLFGNNVANISTIYLATFLWLYYYGAVGQVYFIAIITILLFCISEIAPKIIFRTFANEILYRTVGILKFFDVFFTPFTIWFFIGRNVNKLNNNINKNNNAGNFSNAELQDFSKEDFKNIIEKVKQEGPYNDDQITFMQKLSNLSKIKIVELMTPIADLLLLHVDQDISEVQNLLKKEGRNLIPVFDKRIDNIVGYIDTLDVYISKKKATTVKDFLKKPTFEPDICSIDKIYQQFQNFHNHMVVAVNEHGGCSGIITEDDFVMNIFGLRYENAATIDVHIKRVAHNRYNVDSSVDIDDLNELLGMNIKKVGFETLGGFAIYLFGGLATKGMSMYYGEIKIKVLKATHTSIDEVAIVFPEKKKKVKRKNKKLGS